MSIRSSFKNGWSITKTSLHYTRNHKNILIFTFCSALLRMAIFLMFFTLVAIIALATDRSVAAIFITAGIPYLILARFGAVFCATAQSSYVTHLITNTPITISAAFSRARQRLHIVACFAIASVIINKLVTQFLKKQNSGILANIFGSVINLSWQAATFFMIPVIALEITPFTDSVILSAQTFKKVWGESVSGTFTISGIFFGFAFVGCLTLSLISALITALFPPLGFLVLVTGIVAIIVTLATLSSAVTTIFATIAYLYATKGIAGPFDRATLETSFISNNQTKNT